MCLANSKLFGEIEATLAEYGFSLSLLNLTDKSKEKGGDSGGSKEKPESAQGSYFGTELGR